MKRAVLLAVVVPVLATSAQARPWSCDPVNVDANPAVRVEVLHKRNDVLRIVDKNKNGCVDTSELAELNLLFSNTPVHADPNDKSIPIDIADAELERGAVPPPADNSAPGRRAAGGPARFEKLGPKFAVLLTEQYRPVTLFDKEADLPGALFSFKRDNEADTSTWTARGAVAIAMMQEFEPPESDAAFLSRYAVALGLGFDRVHMTGASTKENTIVQPQLTGELQFFNLLFDSDILRWQARYTTDLEADTGIAGGFVEWQPVEQFNQGFFRLSSPIILGPVAFKFSPTVRVEAGHAFGALPAAAIPGGDNYLRVGPTFTGDLWLDGMFSRVSLHGFYSPMYDVDGGDWLEYAELTGRLGLDPSGVAALTATYRRGRLPTTLTKVDDYVIGLNVRLRLGD